MWSFGFHGASVQGSYVLPCCPEPQFFRFEGVWLTETGMAVLRNLTMSPLHKRRQRRGRLGLPGEAGLEGSEPSDALGPDDKKDGDLDTDDLLKGEGGVEQMECEIKLEGPASPDVELGKEETEESKKRKRKPYRPGEAWGGFVGAVRGNAQALVASHS